MTYSKKTVKIQELKEFANQQLASRVLSHEEKLGVISIIETALRMANAYNGFMFLELPNGEAPHFDDPEWANRKYL